MMDDVVRSAPEVPAQPPVRLGTSACLLGQEVRHDGGHQRDLFLTETLRQHFELVPVCPEVAIGLGVPRPPIRLRRQGAQVRVVGVRDAGLDVTDALADYGGQMGARLGDLSGYVFKSKSPSCGLFRVPVYPGGDGAPDRNGRGEYARALTEALPLLPVEEEGRLHDPVLRENFFERVFVLYRWQRMLASGLSAASLVSFHTRHKFLILAHGQSAYRRLGRLIAGAGAHDIADVAEQYVADLMSSLTRRATRRGHANVLQHLQGYLKRRVDTHDKAELADVIGQYRIGRVPLVVPVTLLKHHFRKHPVRYVEGQVYLDPHPAELMLRNLI